MVGIVILISSSFLISAIIILCQFLVPELQIRLGDDWPSLFLLTIKVPFSKYFLTIFSESEADKAKFEAKRTGNRTENLR